MEISRRDFLKKGGLALLLLGLAGPLSLFEADRKHQQAMANNLNKHLIVIQLSGGNDGLNTVIPYGIGTYYDNRPTLAYAQKDVLQLNNTLGLHPNLKGLKKLYDQGHLAIINGVGYPNPNRSHFRSMDIWQTAAPDQVNVTTGWLGRYHDLTYNANDDLLSGLTIGAPSRIYMANKFDAPAIENVQSFQLMIQRERQAEKDRRLQAFRQMYQGSAANTPLGLVQSKGAHALQASEILDSSAKKAKPGTGYPANSSFATHLQLLAELMAARVPAKTYFTQLGGFDDHSNEKNAHARVLQDLDQSLSAFYQDLQSKNLANQVVILIYSEFGRRVKENASGGTDHGTAAPVFLLGGQVKGGLYGELPSLTNLDNGDLKYNVDFRSVYATALDKWLLAPSKDVLGHSFETLSVF